jgi:hypothetical protein
MVFIVLLIYVIVGCGFFIQEIIELLKDLFR